MSVPPHRRSLAEPTVDRTARGVRCEAGTAPASATSSAAPWPTRTSVSGRTSAWQRPIERRLSVTTVSVAAADSKTITSTDSRQSLPLSHPHSVAPPPPPRMSPIVPPSRAHPDPRRSQRSDGAARRVKPPPPPPLLSSFFAPVVAPPHTRHESPDRSQPWPRASPAAAADEPFDPPPPLPLPPPPTPLSPSRSRNLPRVSAPADEPDRDGDDGRLVCEDQTVSVATYNILSTELDGEAHHVGSRREHLAFEYRLRGVRRKLGEFVAQAAVVCMQEMTRKWREALAPFFAEHGYSLMSQTYGGGGVGSGSDDDGGESKHSDGVAIALPPHLAVASWSVIRVADVIRRLAHRHLSRRPTPFVSGRHLETLLRDAAVSERVTDEKCGGVDGSDDRRRESETVPARCAADNRKVQRRQTASVERKEPAATSSETDNGGSSSSGSSDTRPVVLERTSFCDEPASSSSSSSANPSAPSCPTDSAAAERSRRTQNSDDRRQQQQQYDRGCHYSHKLPGRRDRPSSLGDIDVAPRLRAAIERATTRENLLLVMRVRDRRTAHGGGGSSGGEFVVGTYHSPCAYTDPEVLAMHVGVASHVVQTYAPGLPCVLAGDLNVRPRDPAYAMLRSGFALAGLGECDDRDDDSGALRVGGLRSAYAASRSGREPAHTVHSLVAHSRAPFTDTLDYILFSRHWRGVIAVAELPAAPTAASHPSEHEPSDHLALCATLVL